MTDLDSRLRDVARIMVADAPAPPSFPDGAVVRDLAPSRRRPAALVAWAAASIAVVAATALAVRDYSEPATVHTASDGGGLGAPAACGGPLPFAIEVPGATAGPIDGPAPGADAPAPGQLVRHWTRAEGAVEVRWPASPQALYGDGLVTQPSVAEGFRGGRSEIDVAPTGTSVADVVVARGDGRGAGGACEVLQLSVGTASGTWTSGLRQPANGSQAPYEPVDLQPRIVEQRDVTTVPGDAVPCRGADRDGTPANRKGGVREDLRGTQAADALLAFLAATPGAPQSGYVEMRAPDGSITYAADPSGSGWTALLTVRHATGDWYVASVAMSGC